MPPEPMFQLGIRFIPDKIYRCVSPSIFQVPELKMALSTPDFAEALSSFDPYEAEGQGHVPVYTSLTNISKIKVLVKDPEPRTKKPKKGKPDKDRYVCSILRKHGYVVSGKLRAMVVYDEADQNINADVDKDEPDAGMKQTCAALFTTRRTVGEQEDGHGEVISADNFFDLFTVNLDVTATPHALIYANRDVTKRTTHRIITGIPSKHGFQYEKLPNWKSKEITRAQVPAEHGISIMINDMLKPDQTRNRHAAVVDKNMTTELVSQRIQATRYAAQYREHGLITMTWSSNGVSVFTRCQKPESGKDVNLGYDDCDPLNLVQRAFNLPGAETIGESIQMYQSDEGIWDTLDLTTKAWRNIVVDEEKRFQKEKSKWKKEIARTGDGQPIEELGGSPKYLYDVFGTGHAWVDENGLRSKVRSDLKKDQARLESDCEALKKSANDNGRTTWIACYTADYGYPEFIDRFVIAINEQDVKPKVNTVVFGKGIMTRGVTVKGADKHACSLTDMYVNVDTHFTSMIQVCGRLCGNSYLSGGQVNLQHECNASKLLFEGGTPGSNCHIPYTRPGPSQSSMIEDSIHRLIFPLCGYTFVFF